MAVRPESADASRAAGLLATVKRMRVSPLPGPPQHALGGVVPVQRFAVQTAHAVIALPHITAYPEGCVLALHAAVRRDGLDEETWLLASEVRRARDPEWARTDLRASVRLSGGTVVTALGGSALGRARAAGPGGAYRLTPAGHQSSTSGHQFHQRQLQLWFSPLPPPGPFAFTVEWPCLGISPASLMLDGTAVRQAAWRSLPYWPGLPEQPDLKAGAARAPGQ